MIQKLSSRVRAGISSFFIGHSRRYYAILLTVGFLTVVGVVMVLSSSSIDSIKAGDGGFLTFGKQLLFAVLGFGALITASKVSFERIRPWVFHALVGSVILQLLTVYVIGTSVNGNKNWIRVGFITIQPAEIIKLTMLLYLAEYLSRRQHLKEYAETWSRPFFISLVAIGSVILGKDMGTAIVMVAMLFGVLIFDGMPRPWIVRYALLLGVLGTLVLNQSGSRAGRINAWLHPDAPDPNQYNWQQQHAVWAFASGGLFGTGLGNSQLKWSWIPEAENDFIFAIIGEEGGLFFAILIIGLFVALAWMLLFSGENSTDDFSRILTLGVMLWISVQALINIGVVIGFAPVLGVPLPLMSAGGSSLIMILTAVGFVLGAERQHGFAPVRRTR